MVGWGRSASLFGKVLGSLPLGLTEPKRTLPRALAPSRAGVPGFEDGGGGVDPGHGDGRCRSRSTTMVCGIGRGDRCDERVLIVRQREGGQVHAFALPLVGEDDGYVGALGEPQRLRQDRRRNRT